VCSFVDNSRGFHFQFNEMPKKFGWDDDFGDIPQEPTPVMDLPWYQSLRTLLEPYDPVKEERDSDQQFTSAEIISSIEQHHGVPQGPQQGLAKDWILPEDFVRAMEYLGYRAVNAGGLQLQWLMKKKLANSVVESR
jgi:hypothetical protein